MSTPIKVMTFNMRINTPVDGDNWFRNRRPKIAEVIRRENPDIIGFQEIDEEMQDFLCDSFPRVRHSRSRKKGRLFLGGNTDCVPQEPFSASYLPRALALFGGKSSR